MKTDRYTKTIFTIIAIGIFGLNIHFFKDEFVSLAQAYGVEFHTHNSYEIYGLEDHTHGSYDIYGLEDHTHTCLVYDTIAYC